MVENTKAHLPAMVDATNAKRSEMLTKLHVAVEKVIDARSTLRKDLGTAYACLPGCGIAEICFANFVQALKQNRLYPLSAITSKSFMNAFTNATDFRHSVPGNAYACGNKDCIGRSPRLGIGSLPYLCQEVEKIRRELIGPCLHWFIDAGKIELEGCVHLPPKAPTTPDQVYDAAEVEVTGAPQPPTLPRPLPKASQTPLQPSPAPQQTPVAKLHNPQSDRSSSAGQQGPVKPLFAAAGQATGSPVPFQSNAHPLSTSLDASIAGRARGGGRGRGLPRGGLTSGLPRGSPRD
ncbi:hypothetical protein Slin15195_G090320 [Septoria linicola]|uniref:Uncharacterized protein n=1 Tax=Septoria linicola TaxID=215465 RepID=A0A9Q9ENQ9_9PEZI|nr:hypothetical protein Slin15195_G090320 [Septoria linicola]